MTAIFEKILEMSAVAGIVIMAVLVLRLCLKKAPKKYSYILWAVVLVRLLCPFAPESNFSTMPRNNGAVELLEDWQDDYVGEMVTYHDNLTEYDAAVNAGVEPIYTPGGSYVNVAPDGVTPAPTVKTEWMPILSNIWLCGIAAMAAWAVVDWLRLRLRLRTAIREEEGVYTTDEVDSPFVLGLVRPKIYLPAAIEGAEREYILLHERCHLRRFDHWIKLLAFAALAIHWFNPLVWLAFVLSSRDMEMSCDEAVIRQLGGEKRADYSASLLALATGRRRVSVTPLAFGEGDPKGRIRNLANWKKPTVWIIIVAVAVCIVAAVCLLTDPVSPKAQIKVFDCIYTHHGKIDKKGLPPGEFAVGELMGIVRDTSEPPIENYHATNLDERYVGQSICHVNGDIYLCDENGHYLVFTLDKGQNEPEFAGIQIWLEGRGYHYNNLHADALPYLSRSVGTLDKNVKSPGEIPEGQFAGINIPDYLLGNELWKQGSELYLDDGNGGWWMFVGEGVEQTTEVLRGDFDRDGREDYFEVVQHSQSAELAGIILKDAETGEELWSDDLSTDESNRKLFMYIEDSGEGGRFVRYSYDPVYDNLSCRSFYIENGREKVIKQWITEMPELPDVSNKEEFIKAVTYSLAENSTVLASSLGGVLVIGPISAADKLAYSEPTEVFRGDFDHDGEDEIAVVLPDPLYGDVWSLKLMNPDGSIAWSEVGFSTAHAGHNCILAYAGEDGKDYLIRYNPYMNQGYATYRCEQFYIDNSDIGNYKEVVEREWLLEFRDAREMTAEMQEFADAMESLLSRSYVLLSTLDFELQIGPVRGDAAGLLPVDFGLEAEGEAWEAFCKGAIADMMAAEVSHYTWNIYVDGVHRTDMPQNEGWFLGNDWLRKSKSESEGRSHEQVMLEKDGMQYAWTCIDGTEQLLTSANGEFDAYGRGNFNAFLDYDLSFVSKTETAYGTELVFEINTGGDPATALQSYTFDTDMHLSEIRIESNSDLREADGTVTAGTRTTVIAFPCVSEATARNTIEEAYENIMAAQETESTSDDEEDNQIIGYEEYVEKGALEEYGVLVDNIMSEYLKQYRENPMEFKRAELTRFVYLGGYDHADGSRVDIYDFRFALIPTVVDSDAVAGGAYLDSQNRFQGFGPTHLAIKHKTGADVEYAMLSDSFFIYSGGAVNAESRDIIERNLQSLALNGTPDDAIIDDGSRYPLAVPYGKTVITDLDGDGVKEQVCQSVNSGGYRIESFTVNGVEYIGEVREKCGPFENTNADYYQYWYITDILESDGRLEITVYDDGPSGDPETHFYRCGDGGISYAGTVLSPAAGLKYDGKGYITGSARLAVFQTWYAEHTWNIFGMGDMIQPEPKEFYEVDFRFRDYVIGDELFPGSDTNPLLQEIVAYAAADKASESWTLPVGTQIGLLGTDNREWLLATADGEECWLHFEGTSLDAPGGLMREASKVLKGLHYFD